jgi:WD40 repeat protein
MNGNEKVVGMDVDYESDIAVVAGSSGTVHAVSLKNGMPVWSDRVSSLGAQRVIKSPDGKSVGVLFSDGRVRIWKLDTGSRITRESSPLKISFFVWLDSNRIVSAHDGGTIKLWMKNNPDRTLFEWKVPSEVSALSARKNKDSIFVGQVDGAVHVVNANFGKAVKIIDHGELVSGLKFNRRENQIFIYHLPTQQLVTRLSDPSLGENIAHRDLVQSLSFSPDGKTLASGGFRVVKLWSNRINEKVRIVNIMNGNEKVVGMDVDYESDIAVVAGSSGTVHAVSLKNGMPVWSDRVSSLGAQRVIKSPDGKSVGVLFSDGRVRIWKLDTGSRITRESSPLKISFFVWLDSNRIVSAHDGGTIKLWMKNNPDRTLFEWKVPSEVSALSARKNKDSIFVGQVDGAVHVVNANFGKAVKIIDHGELVSGLKFNRRENQIFIYHLPTQQLVTRLSDPSLGENIAHRDLVQSLSFSPDGKTLASGGFRVVKLWSNRINEKVRIVNIMNGNEKVVGMDVDYVNYSYFFINPIRPQLNNTKSP